MGFDQPFSDGRIVGMFVGHRQVIQIVECLFFHKRKNLNRPRFVALRAAAGTRGNTFGPMLIGTLVVHAPKSQVL